MKRRNFLKSIFGGVTTLFFGEKLVAKTPKHYRGLYTFVERPENSGPIICCGADTQKFVNGTWGWVSFDKKPDLEASGEFRPGKPGEPRNKEEEPDFDFLPNVFVAKPIPNKKGWYYYYAAHFNSISKY